MRIAFFIEIFFPEIHGVLTSTLDLARNLKSLGHHVILVVPRAKSCEAIHEVDGMAVFKVPSIPSYIYPGVRINFPWSRTLSKIMRKENIEILHTTGPGFLGMAVANHAKKYRTPLVQTFHTLLYEEKYLLYLIRLRCLLPLGRLIARHWIGRVINVSDLVTAPARFTCEELKKLFPKKTIRHISNGIDFSLFRTYPAKDEFLAKHPFFTEKTFMFVGRVGMEKSIDVLIRGFAEAVKIDRSLRLAIVGDGPSGEAMKALVVEHGVQDEIVFLGKMVHAGLLASGLLQYSRAFITASVTENQPMTVIEAACCGLPLILADAAGLKELAGDTAMFFPAGDEAALKDCILRLAKDDGLHAKLGAASRELARNFDGNNVARQFEAEYERLLAGFADHGGLPVN